MKERHILSTWKKVKVPRGKNHNKTETKTTVSLYLSKSLVEQAKIHKLSLSRVTEQALLSIIDYMAVQKINSSSDFSLSTGSLFPKRESVDVPRAGFELKTDGDITHTILLFFRVICFKKFCCKTSITKLFACLTCVLFLDYWQVRLFNHLKLFLRYADLRLILISSFGLAIMFLAIGKVA